MATRKFTGRVGRTIETTQFQFENIESPSKGKPNVVYIVLDDTGFAQLGCYGSTINTPNIDRLAKEGLRYQLKYQHGYYRQLSKGCGIST